MHGSALDLAQSCILDPHDAGVLDLATRRDHEHLGVLVVASDCPGGCERRLLLQLPQAVHNDMEFGFDDLMVGVGGARVQPSAVTRHVGELHFLGLALVVHTRPCTISSA